MGHKVKLRRRYQVKRTLRIENDEKGKQRTMLLYNGFVIGGNKLLERSQNRDRAERSLGAAVIKMLRSGHRTKDTLEPPTDGAILEFSQQQHELLVKYLDACPWSTQELEEAADLLDWVMAAPQVDNK